MSVNASPDVVELLPGERLELLFAELAELTGQRNAIDGRIVEIIAEVDRDELWGNAGARSVASHRAALIAEWKRDHGNRENADNAAEHGRRCRTPSMRS